MSSSQLPPARLRWVRSEDFNPQTRFGAASVDAVSAVDRTVLVIESARPQRVGQELRFELLSPTGATLAEGHGRVAAAERGRFRFELASCGIDGSVLANLAPGVARRGPPPLHSHAPPPMPVLTAPSSREHTTVRPAGAAAHRFNPGEPPESARTIPAFALDDDEPAPLLEQVNLRSGGIIIGIDLGTTNTCASYVVDGRPMIIPTRMGGTMIPSMISFDPDGGFHVGQRAMDRAVLHPLRTVYGSKRLLGRTFRPDLAAELQTHFAFPLAEADGQRFGVRIDDRVVSMDTIAARVLDEVRISAEKHLGKPVEAAVITVPAYFTEVQREAVRRAAKQANLAVHRIVNEPTAAAIAYGHKQAAGTRIAVFDFGGGTFDFSVVDVGEEHFEVVLTGGECFLGGSDFDDLLASHLLTEFCRIEQVELAPTPQQVSRLREAAEEAKRQLSSESDHIVLLQDFTTAPRRDLRVQLMREELEVIFAPLIERATAIVCEVLDSGGLKPSDVNDVVLVGGTTRIPAVQEAVSRLFGRRPSKRINPDEAVALGAALLAAEIGSGQTTLVDILPMSVGRAVAGAKYEPILPRFERLPARAQLTVPADILGSVVVPLFQGDAKDARRNEYLCTVMVEDRSLWDGGQARIEISFDEHCVMAVEARHAKTGRPLPVKLDRSRTVEAVLAELGVGGSLPPPEDPEPWSLPKSSIGGVLSQLGSFFRR